MASYEVVSFLSDYGTDDEFVGVIKSVMHSIAPHATVVDITHGIKAYDVRAGSLALVRAAPYLCPGVVLAVVDPGVGTERRAVAVEVGDGESVLVGPDNGLLAPVAALVGGASRAVELQSDAHQLMSPGFTFAGRDVFAPAVAHLCSGVDLTELGSVIDPADLQPAMVRFSAEKDGVLEADVIWIDRYGNAQLNVTPDQLEKLGNAVIGRFKTTELSLRRVRAYGDLQSGETGVLVDSSGLIAIARFQESAAEHLDLDEESSVSLRADPTAGEA